MSENKKSRSIKNLYPEKYQAYLQSESYKRRNARQQESNAAKYECKKRANFICSHCGAEALDSHHIIPVDSGGTDEQSNLVCLCRKCHQQVHRGVYTVDKETKQLLPVINPEHIVENKPDYIRTFEEENNLTLYKSTGGWYAFINNIKVIFEVSAIKEAVNYTATKYKRKEVYHQVAKMKREIVEASKEMKWSQGKEIRKFIRNYQEDRDFEILVKLYNAILGGK